MRRQGDTLATAIREREAEKRIIERNLAAHQDQQVGPDVRDQLLRIVGEWHQVVRIHTNEGRQILRGLIVGACP